MNHWYWYKYTSRMPTSFFYVLCTYSNLYISRPPQVRRQKTEDRRQKQLNFSKLSSEVTHAKSRVPLCKVFPQPQQVVHLPLIYILRRQNPALVYLSCPLSMGWREPSAAMTLTSSTRVHEHLPFCARERGGDDYLQSILYPRSTSQALRGHTDPQWWGVHHVPGKVREVANWSPLFGRRHRWPREYPKLGLWLVRVS